MKRNTCPLCGLLLCRFDEVFSAATTTSELFATLRHKVERTADGINVSIIAHGATGSGNKACAVQCEVRT